MCIWVKKLNRSVRDSFSLLSSIRGRTFAMSSISGSISLESEEMRGILDEAWDSRSWCEMRSSSFSL